MSYQAPQLLLSHGEKTYYLLPVKQTSMSYRKELCLIMAKLQFAFGQVPEIPASP